MSQKFLKLNTEEREHKLSLLFKELPIVEIWGKNLARLEASLHVQANDKISFQSKSEIIEQELYFLRFSIRDRIYFGTIWPDSVSENSLIGKIVDIYSLESRDEERALFYPHRNVHAHIDLGLQGDQPQSNVIFLGKTNSQDDKLVEYQKESNIVRLERHFDRQTAKRLSSFRVLDMSLSGMALLINGNERIHFLNAGKLDIKVVIGDNLFEFENVTVRHTVEFISPKFKHTEMFKIGLHFEKAGEDYQDMIKAITDEEYKITSAKEFEELFN